MAFVSVITPTFNREKFHEQLFYCMRTQDFENFEWLVLDDSPQPSSFLSQIKLPWLKYTHMKKSLSLGEKRNWLLQRSKGEIIIQFDDDDYYSSNYISSMHGFMESHKLDFINLQSWYLLDLRHNFFGYWNLTNKEGLHFRLTPNAVSAHQFGKPGNLQQFPALEEDMHLGWGFGYAYRRQVWEQCNFPDLNWNEEMALSRFAHKNLRSTGLLDTNGLCLHILHHDSSSVCFPQYHLPLHVMKEKFPNFKII